ncbi:hypothetical protein CNECB9_3470017 [Cupriavidus necator]|uniref:Uncharacterized protein n=1 Tax=Cupriavidus necator TaxID=106590 RepID=A0A1K0IHN7_CUPNE|nr:hypothetical protein CNECB9_3470017 [Cupriavidus necator]
MRGPPFAVSGHLTRVVFAAPSSPVP